MNLAQHQKQGPTRGSQDPDRGQVARCDCRGQLVVVSALGSFEQLSFLGLQQRLRDLSTHAKSSEIQEKTEENEEG
jgi:hypothetical protein